MQRYSDETIVYAASRGIEADELPLIVNGCSGGLSWLYALGGKVISVEQCCHRHDIDYQLGGTDADRKAADDRLYTCAMRKAGGNTFKKARAVAMWGAVRLFGMFFWAGE